MERARALHLSKTRRLSCLVLVGRGRVVSLVRKVHRQIHGRRSFSSPVQGQQARGQKERRGSHPQRLQLQQRFRLQQQEPMPIRAPFKIQQQQHQHQQIFLLL